MPNPAEAGADAFLRIGTNDEISHGRGGTTVTSPTTESDNGGAPWVAGFNAYLLGGIVVLMVFGFALAGFLYLLPPEPLQLSELQPAFVVAPVAQLPVGGSRVVDWGNRVILVVRTADRTYTGLQGTSPTDSCILNWDQTSLSVLSPCSYIVYDLQGNVVRGLTTVPLQRYPVFVRDDVVYVGRQ
ncbi:MAG: ubiquinol-cytochrome c reductase iron-sulfur subunit [Gemmatimonadaceae bacterium]